LSSVVQTPAGGSITGGKNQKNGQVTERGKAEIKTWQYIKQTFYGSVLMHSTSSSFIWEHRHVQVVQIK